MIGKLLDRFCLGLRVCVGLLTMALAFPVAAQVLARYTGIIPVYLWTEELATFIFVWVVMIGSMIAVWDGTHFNVEVLPAAKTPLGTLIQKGLVLVLLIAFGGVFAWYGVEYTKIRQHPEIRHDECKYGDNPYLGADRWCSLGDIRRLPPQRGSHRIPQFPRVVAMIVSTALACAILVGGFLVLVALRVPVAFALGLATMPIVLLDLRLTPLHPAGTGCSSPTIPSFCLRCRFFCWQRT